MVLGTNDELLNMLIWHEVTLSDVKFNFSKYIVKRILMLHRLIITLYAHAKNIKVKGLNYTITSHYSIAGSVCCWRPFCLVASRENNFEILPVTSSPSWIFDYFALFLLVLKQTMYFLYHFLIAFNKTKQTINNNKDKKQNFYLLPKQYDSTFRARALPWKLVTIESYCIV